MQKKSLQTILYSTAGVVVMLVIIIAFNFIVGAVRARHEHCILGPRPGG